MKIVKPTNGGLFQTYLQTIWINILGDKNPTIDEID